MVWADLEMRRSGFAQPALRRWVDADHLHPETIVSQGLGHTPQCAKRAQESLRRRRQEARCHIAFNLARRNRVRPRDAGHCLRQKTESPPEETKAGSASSGTVADQASLKRRRWNTTQPRERHFFGRSAPDAIMKRSIRLRRDGMVAALPKRHRNVPGM